MDQVSNVQRSSVVGKEIVFENLNALELRCRDRFELVFQCPTQGNGGDSRLHRCHLLFLTLQLYIEKKTVSRSPCSVEPVRQPHCLAVRAARLRSGGGPRVQ